MQIYKKTLFLSILLLTISSFGASNLELGVAEIGKSISDSMLQEGKKKIAVIEFSDLNDNVTDLGRFLAEELINELLKNKKEKGYEIVERRQLNKVLKQLKLSSSGLLDPKSMKEVGKILNVDSIVTGSLTDLGNDIKVNARIISVESAMIISSASTKIPKVGSVAKLMGQNSVKVSSDSLSSISSSVTPSKISSIPHGKYFFENKDILIKYTKMAKSYGSGVSMLIEYHNKSDKPLSIEILSSYVTNDSGEKSYDGTNSIFVDNKIIVDPKRTIFSKAFFNSIGKTGIFTIKALYSVNNKDVEVKIYDMPIK